MSKSRRLFRLPTVDGVLFALFIWAVVAGFCWLALHVLNNSPVVYWSVSQQRPIECVGCSCDDIPPIHDKIYVE